jgi:hypothetical protein
MAIWYRILAFLGLSDRVEPSNGQLLDIPAIVESEVSEIEPCPHYPIFLGSDGNLKSNYSYLAANTNWR